MKITDIKAFEELCDLMKDILDNNPKPDKDGNIYGTLGDNIDTSSNICIVCKHCITKPNTMCDKEIVKPIFNSKIVKCDNFELLKDLSYREELNKKYMRRMRII